MEFLYNPSKHQTFNGKKYAKWTDLRGPLLTFFVTGHLEIDEASKTNSGAQTGDARKSVIALADDLCSQLIASSLASDVVDMLDPDDCDDEQNCVVRTLN